MARYVGVAALTAVKVSAPGGRTQQVQVHEGFLVPDGALEDDVKRLLDEGFIAVVPDAPAPAVVPVEPTRTHGTPQRSGRQ